jgi:hypothetical protein
MSVEPLQLEAPPEDSKSNKVALQQRSPVWDRRDRVRLLIWVGIGFLLPAAFIFGFHIGPGRSGSVLSVGTEMPSQAIMVFFVSLATWIVSRIEGRPLDDYGIPLRAAFGRRFWEGSVWGFTMLSAILLIHWLSGHFRIDSVALSGSAVYKWALAWAATFLAVSLTEEFASVVFGAAHIRNHGENALGVMQVVETGLLFCLTIRRTGNLWFAVGFHAAWDWAETFFYGTPDSGLLGVDRLLHTVSLGPKWLTGGSAGPEGSLVAFVMLLLCAFLIHLRFPNTIYPDRHR